MIRVVHPGSGSRGTGSRIRNTGIYPPCPSAAVHPALKGRRLDDLSFGISFRLNKQLCMVIFFSFSTVLYSTLIHLLPLDLIHSASYSVLIFANAIYQEPIS